MQKYTLFILLVILPSLFYGSSSSLNDNTLIGFWVLFKTKNIETKQVNTPNKNVYYHFHEDNTLTMTDSYKRERSQWQWKLINNRLIITSDIDGIKIQGTVVLTKKDNIVYRIRTIKNSYLWFFEKLD